MFAWMRQVSARTQAGKKKAAAEGGLEFPDASAPMLVAVPAGPFPRDQIADGGAG